MDQFITDAPLAREETDFIALAEEEVGTFDERTGTWGAAPEPVARALADQSVEVTEAIKAEFVPIDNNLTGGYKGPESSSVAGAGEQTADDPFGLNITETAPPEAREWQSLRSGWRYTSWYNVLIMIVGILILVGGAFAGLYFGFVKKKAPSKSAPVAVLHDFVQYTVSGDSALAAGLDAPGSKFGTDIRTLLGAYQKEGLIILKEFDATASEVTDTSATVNISEFIIEVQNERGEKELISVLDIRQPYRLPRTIMLIKQGNEWVISS